MNIETPKESSHFYSKPDKHSSEIVEQEQYWWDRWESSNWVSNTSSSSFVNATGLLPPINESLHSKNCHPLSIDNNSTEGVDELALLGDHGGTSGQPADRWNPALPKFPNFEGHWFPKQSHSILYFQCAFGWTGNQRLDIVIEQDQDSYSRYFYVRCDGVLVHSSVIGSSGFNGHVLFYTTLGSHRIELEIYYGGYKNHGWKLVYFWPYTLSGGRAGNVEGEYFPKIYRSTLQYWVECGDDTILNLDIQRINDRYTRFLSIYLDGNTVVSERVVSGSHQFEFNIGDYANPPDPGDPIGDPTMHELKLQIRSGSYCEYGWRVNLCAIHYESVFVEVDWMKAGNGCTGHEPPASVVEYVEAYYKVHGYERVDFQINSTGNPHEEMVEPDTFLNTYIPTFFDHINDSENWRYVVFGHYGPPGYYGYIHPDDTDCAFLADEYLDTEEKRRTTLMHEFGHTLGIIELDVYGGEYYCANWACCMAEASPHNMVLEPWYCGVHWATRTDPLWKYWGT
ncbi:MAG: hypothetical protein ACFFCF_09275 [Promethearchaeota archaeon]